MYVKYVLYLHIVRQDQYVSRLGNMKHPLILENNVKSSRVKELGKTNSIEVVRSEALCP